MRILRWTTLLAVVALVSAGSAHAAAGRSATPSATDAPAAPYTTQAAVTEDGGRDVDAALMPGDERGTANELAADDEGGAGGADGRRMHMRRGVRGSGDGPMAMDRGDDGATRRWGGPAGLHGRMRGGRRGPGRMGMGPGGPGGPGGFLGMMRHLDLSDSQRERLRDLHERQQRRDIQSRADVQIARLELRRAMTANRPESGEIDAQIDKLARLRADQAKSHMAMVLEARALLTPEQLEKAKAMRARMAMGMRGPGAMGGPGGPDGRRTWQGRGRAGDDGGPDGGRAWQGRGRAGDDGGPDGHRTWQGRGRADDDGGVRRGQEHDDDDDSGRDPQ